jgi:hypothetical protein
MAAFNENDTWAGCRNTNETTEPMAITVTRITAIVSSLFLDGLILC